MNIQPYSAYGVFSGHACTICGKAFRLGEPIYVLEGNGPTYCRKHYMERYKQYLANKKKKREV